ncbi:MAG: J domain-containing protein [Deinococcales bacterium]
MAANYYHILGVDYDADITSIRSAYRKLAKEMHPDRNPGDPFAKELFQRVNEAYQVLSDSRRRNDYDHELYQSLYQANQKFEDTRLFDTLLTQFDSQPALNLWQRLRGLPLLHFFILLLLGLLLYSFKALMFYGISLTWLFFAVHTAISSWWLARSLSLNGSFAHPKWMMMLPVHVLSLAVAILLMIPLTLGIGLIRGYLPYINDLQQAFTP